MLLSLNLNILRLLLARMLRRRTHILHVLEVSSAEQLVHALQRKALGLGAEEVDEHDHGRAEGAEDEVGSVAGGAADGQQHHRRGARDDEVEEPLRGSCQGHVEAAEPGRGDLRHVDPADGAPAELEADGEDVHHYQRDVAGWRDGAVGSRRIEADVETEVEHGKGHREAGAHEGLPSADCVRQEQEEGSAAGDLADAVHASGEERVRVAADAERGKDGGSVVVDGIGTGHLLANLRKC